MAATGTSRPERAATAECLCIGDELLIGQTVNTNAAWMGEQLGLSGFRPILTRVVGDDPDRIGREPLRPTDQRVYRADSHSGNFLDCIRTRRPTICDPKTAAATMNTILIGGIALFLRRNLKWDPGRAEFVGDAEANRLLSYSPRPPWHL